MQRTVESKGDYARRHGRAPSSVSNWIAEGKISPEALIGTGVRARIWVERADADLARSLDPGQQAAQAHPIEGAIMTPPAPPRASLAATTTPVGEDLADDFVRRRRKADADRAEHEAEMARRKLAVDDGRWIDAAAAQRAWSAELAKLLAGVDTFLGNRLAHAIADRFGLDWKELAVLLRQEFRRHRDGVADEAEAVIDQGSVLEAAE